MDWIHVILLADFCEHGDEPSVLIFPDQLIEQQIHKQETV